MADILISKFTTQIPRVGAIPATPGFAESEGQDPVAPSGTPQVYTPVTIGSPANGLSISGSQLLTIGLASTSTTGALSSTDWNTFNGKIGGSIASGQVAFGTGVNTVGGSIKILYEDLLSNSFLSLYRNDISGGTRARFYTIGDPTAFELGLQGTISDFVIRYGGSIFYRLTTTGNTMIGSSSAPTNTLDINGTARIRTINNLGVSATNVLVPDATGVVSLRTASQFLADAGGISGTIASGQVAFGIGTNTITGDSRIRFSTGNFSFQTLSTLSNAGSASLQVENDVSANKLYVLNYSTLSPGTLFGITRNNLAGVFTDGNSAIVYGAVSNIPVYIGSNNIIRQTILANGNIGIATTSPTNTLDVNGTARIRTISNLGSAATSVLVPSATGVLSLRTLAELASDGGFGSLSGLTTNRFIKATSSSTVGNTGVTEESAISYLFGSRTGSVSATPLVLSLGGTFANNAIGNEGNQKLKIYETGAGTSYGMGVSSALFEFQVPTGASFGFYHNGARSLLLESTGRATIGNNNGLLNLSVTGTTAISSANNLLTLSCGASVSTGTAGSNGSVKLSVYDFNGATAYGFGVSTALFEIISPTGAAIGFFPANTRSMTILANGNLSFEDGKNIQFATATGTQIGTATNQRLAFYGSTPIVKPSGDILTALSNLGLIASPTITQVDQFAVKTTATADQTLPSGTLTILDYDTTLLNNSTATYTVGTDGRITINSTGVYTITAGVVIEADAVTALESAFLGIFRNGDLVAISSINTTIAAGAQSGLSTSTILSLTATDIIDCRALVNSVGGVANGLARRLGTLLGANATQVNSLSITKNSM